MVLPELVRKRAEKDLGAFCERGLPLHKRHQMRLEFAFRGSAVTLIERRAPWDPATKDQTSTSMPIAQFRYDADSSLWTLFWPDRNTRWHRDDAPPTADLSTLIDEVDRDPTGIYLG